MLFASKVRQAGADPGCWFRGYWHGVCGTEVFRWGPGAEPLWPVGVWGRNPRRMLRHEAEKTTYGEKKNKSIQTDIV